MSKKDLKKEENEEVVPQEDAQVEEVIKEPTELELAQAKADDFEDKYLRMAAEMQNIQRRSNEERQTLQRYRSQDLAKKILPSIDNLDRALAIDEMDESVRKGIEMVQESLSRALAEEGVEEISSEGTFDPNFHMAVQTVPADDEHPAETIVQVLQKGYKLHERVLRPSMVVVAQ